LTKSEFIPIWFEEIGSQNDNWYQKAHNDDVTGKFYSIASPYTREVFLKAAGILADEAQPNDRGFTPWITPYQFKSALESAKQVVEDNKSGSCTYCPCCCDTGRITASMEQTRERWEDIRITRPDYFRQLLGKSLFTLDRNGDVTGQKYMFACGCRDVIVSTSQERTAGNVRKMAKFSRFFQDEDAKCWSVDGCNPIRGDGKNCCPVSPGYHSVVVEERTQKIKADPYYKKGLRRRKETNGYISHANDERRV